MTVCRAPTTSGIATSSPAELIGRRPLVVDLHVRVSSDLSPELDFPLIGGPGHFDQVPDEGTRGPDGSSRFVPQVGQLDLDSLDRGVFDPAVQTDPSHDQSLAKGHLAQQRGGHPGIELFDGHAQRPIVFQFAKGQGPWLERAERSGVDFRHFVQIHGMHLKPFARDNQRFTGLRGGYANDDFGVHPRYMAGRGGSHQGQGKILLPKGSTVQVGAASRVAERRPRFPSIG